MLSLSKLAAFTLLASAATVKAQAGTCLRTYEVKPGDFCDKISAEQGVSSFQLANVNVGTINAACSNLFPGQIICLARTNLNCSPVAVVETGDTCTSLAAEAGITFSDILTNNPNVNPNCSNIFPGLVLCVQPPAPAPSARR
ncbi:hypothetical protein BKA70DRAFT_1437281 [Coprinopsis sp. MPI-PUGE-AT-0042]|nr:hypothetical protein BKA70DRAFT_1437281 [Coprinopsis sp. MPI-PUGE-AT-0042]